MLKTIRDMAVGAILTFVAAAVVSLAATGTPPGTGPALVDGQWLNGLAGGVNNTYQSGITAAGTTQATAFQLPAGIALMEIDTVPASSGVALPSCLAGTEAAIYNSTATTVTVYPSIRNNPNTSSQDTINTASTLPITTHVITWFACAKDGNWAAK